MTRIFGGKNAVRICADAHTTAALVAFFFARTAAPICPPQTKSRANAGVCAEAHA